jgi:Family of unknown function (DUF5684)
VNAQYSDTSSGGSAVLTLVYIAIYVVQVIGMWRAFEKAGQPGWAAIIPFYNFYILCKIAGRPGWWWILLIVPIVNIVIWIIVSIDAAKAFGKTGGFGIGLALLPFIFWPILGFGEARYVGADGGYGGTSMTPPPPPPPASSNW